MVTLLTKNQINNFSRLYSHTTLKIHISEISKMFEFHFVPHTTAFQFLLMNSYTRKRTSLNIASRASVFGSTAPTYFTITKPMTKKLLIMI